MSADVAARRSEFPALRDGLAYLDSAATSLQPQCVIVAVARAAERAGNPGRGVHRLADAATEIVEETRAKVAAMIGGRADEVIFTSGTTASINLVADAWARAGDPILVTEAEHHSNLLPWQRLGACRVARVDDRGRLDLAHVEELLARGGVKLVAVAHVSNVLGTVAPIAELAALAHAHGARLLIDGAQAVAHLPIDVGAADFYAFSAHKMYGPPGVGVLWARREILDAMPPWQVGGGMVNRAAPHRFEAGTPNTTGIAGLAAAIDFLARADRSDEHRVHAAIVDAVRAAGGRVLGEPALAVVSFTLPGAHPHDIATIADGEGVALRSGHHCAAPLHARFGVDATTRASVACYSSLDDIERFARALAKVREVLG